MSAPIQQRNPFAEPARPTVADLEPLVAFCKANGIRRLRAADVELEFDPPSAPAEIDRIAELNKALLEGQPSDEEMLMWSAAQSVQEAKREAADGA